MSDDEDYGEAFKGQTYEPWSGEEYGKAVAQMFGPSKQGSPRKPLTRRVRPTNFRRKEPKTGFFVFFRDNNRDYKEEHPGLTLQQLINELRQIYKELPEKEKKEYEREAMTLNEERRGGGSHTSPRRSPNRNSRGENINRYGQFLSEHYDNHKRQFPNRTHSERIAELNKIWEEDFEKY
jgi:hypothetical protein